MKNYDVIIVGAGAAGLIAAGSAAQTGARVLLIEKMRQPGRKLLITGKGRCNITNDSAIDEHLEKIHPDGRFLRSAYYQFFTKDILNILHNNGLKTTVERGKRVFPENNKSADVLASIRKWLDQNKIHYLFDCQVTNINRNTDSVTGISYIKDGKEENCSCHSLIIATGGRSYPATGSNGDGYKFALDAGHKVIDARPALVPLVSSGNTASKLQGLSLKNINAILWVDGKKADEEFGEMMFTHFGLTGPVILTLSRKTVDALRSEKNVEISIDLKPALDEKKLDKRILRDLDQNGKKQLENILKNLLPQKMIPIIIELLNLDGKQEGHQLAAKDRKKMVNLLKNLRFRIIDYRGFKEAIITAGGVSTREINPKTLESRLVRNLYFAGEVIDLDADTGGFNLQIAWSTGWLAGQSAGKAACN